MVLPKSSAAGWSRARWASCARACWRSCTRRSPRPSARLLPERARARRAVRERPLEGDRDRRPPAQDRIVQPEQPLAGLDTECDSRSKPATLRTCRDPRRHRRGALCACSASTWVAPGASRAGAAAHGSIAAFIDSRRKHARSLQPLRRRGAERRSTWRCSTAWSPIRSVRSTQTRSCSSSCPRSSNRPTRRSLYGVVTVLRSCCARSRLALHPAVASLPAPSAWPISCANCARAARTAVRADRVRDGCGAVLSDHGADRRHRAGVRSAARVRASA